MIKTCSESLTVPTRLIFEPCLKEGKLPEIWEKVNVVPVHITGAQPYIFGDRGGFLEKRHFNKRFMYKHKSETPQGKLWCFFSKMLLKLHFK